MYNHFEKDEIEKMCTLHGSNDKYKYKEVYFEISEEITSSLRIY
jgi:hypothetical protein